MLAGDKTFSLDTSIVGSIGVMAPGFGAHELIKRLGVERRLFVAGSKKALRQAGHRADMSAHPVDVLSLRCTSNRCPRRAVTPSCR